jgi:general secretion pathway protein G
MAKFFAKLKSNKNGFTLIELLVVISIIGVLSGVVLVAMAGFREKARDARRQSDITQIIKALELYYAENGQYPSSGGTGSVWPNTGWSNSRDAVWDSPTLTNSLGYQLKQYLSLPKDPLNSGASWAYSYSYYSNSYGCHRQWYMLVYVLEKTQMQSPGITACNGTNFNYGGTITIGMRQQ